MKLADDALLLLIDIFRSALVEGKDISQSLRDLELNPDADGKLTARSIQTEG